MPSRREGEGRASRRHSMGPGPEFTGPGWRVLVTDGDPLDELGPPEGELLVIIDHQVTAAGVRRQVDLGRDVLVVYPPAGVERAVALATALVS